MTRTGSRCTVLLLLAGVLLQSTPAAATSLVRATSIAPAANPTRPSRDAGSPAPSGGSAGPRRQCESDRIARRESGLDPSATSSPTGRYRELYQHDRDLAQAVRPVRAARLGAAEARIANGRTSAMVTIRMVVDHRTWLAAGWPPKRAERTVVVVTPLATLRREPPGTGGEHRLGHGHHGQGRRDREDDRRRGTDRRAPQAQEGCPRGGRDAAKKQHDRGKLTARERVELLMDRGPSWRPMLAVHRAHDFGVDVAPARRRRRHRGHPDVDGRKVFVASQDFAVFGGSMGEVHAQGVQGDGPRDAHRRAVRPDRRLRAERVQEGAASLAGYGFIFERNDARRQRDPQISVMIGPCAGEASCRR